MKKADLVPTAEIGQLEWARAHYDVFYDLIDNPAFSAAVRSLANAEGLQDPDLRIMLIWSGIEGLLSVDAELNRRLALYASIMIVGSNAEKAAYFKEVKRAYGVRSKTVHGGRLSKEELSKGHIQARNILCRMLRRCVEIGRVPTTDELDQLSVTPSI